MEPIMNKIILQILCIVTLFATHTAQPMGAFAKKAFEKTCTAVGFGIAVGPLWKTSFQYTKTLLTDHSIFFDEDSSVKEFCHNEIKSIGLDSSKILVKAAPANLQSHAGASSNAIFLCQGKDSLNKKLLKKTALYPYYKSVLNSEYKAHQTPEQIEYMKTQLAKEEQLDNELNEYRFIVQHEANHIKNNDVRNGCIAAFAIPLITHACFSLLKRKTPLTTLGNLRKIPAGLGKSSINFLAIAQYRRYTEQRADDGVNNDKEVLQGGLSFFKKHHENLEALILAADISSDDLQKAKVKDVVKTAAEWTFYISDPYHATPLTRSKKLEDRLKKLEATTPSTPIQTSSSSPVCVAPKI